MEILDRLAERAAKDAAGSGAWRPVFFDPRTEAGRRALGELLDGGRVFAVHDALDEQLEDLAHTRYPGAKGEELRALSAELLGGAPAFEYGAWVFYPWSGRLVHVLGAAEHRELRTNRNRNKITAAEQEVLGRLRLGIVGLSVGQATALTLAMEGIGGLLRLADFDTLSLSNLNRLRAGVHELGIPKVVITARAILELDPFANVEVIETGISPDNADAFLKRPEPLDMVFEECDDLRIKLLLRERARAHRIPVLMETSDRGMIDVERFDREPDRPLLHGLIGDLKAEELVGLSTYEKVPTVLRIIGPNTMSKRMAASLIDVESSLATWPQLASAVALGGAVITDTARRIALGQLSASGRYYVDLEEIISDGVPSRAEVVAPYLVDSLPDPGVRAPPLTVAASEHLDDEQVRALVTYGTMAPSGGNCQPWRFVFRDGALHCLHDVERSRSMLDFQHLASYLAFGAVVENIELAAAAMGLATSVELFPDARGDARAPADLTEVCRLRFAAAASKQVPPLAAFLEQRVTNRRLSRRRPLPEGAASALRAAAAERGGRLQLVESDRELAEMAAILGTGERVRLLSPTMHREMMREVRWSAAEAVQTRDGLDVASLELTPTDLAGLRLVSSWSLMRVAGALGGGEGLGRPTRKVVDAASAIGLVTVDGTSPRDYVQGGRALQRVWLTATSLGLAFQPITALLYTFARLVRGRGEGLSEREIEELRALRRRFAGVFELDDGRAEIMSFRLALAEPPSARALRRPVDEVLTIER